MIASASVVPPQEVQKDHVPPPPNPSAPSMPAPGERVRVAVETQHDFLWRQVRRFGVAQGDVDDVVQQAFVVFAQRIGDIELGAERSFLYAAARNAASNHRRIAGRRRETSDDLALQTAVAPVQNIDDLTQTRALLDRLLAGMDDDLRAVLVMYEVEEMNVPEIAELLEIPTGTAASRLRRAREDVAARLLRHGVTLGSP